jgi:hypothetical protein
MIGEDAGQNELRERMTRGGYINNIGEFSLREAGWTADFDIWFRWTGDGVRPGDNFHVVNGQIDQREKKEAYVREKEHYERYRVKARLTKFFDASRFPFSDEALTIQVEDGAHEAEKLRYVADERGSGINRQEVPQSLKITKSLATVRLHSYGSGRGDPRLSAACQPQARSCWFGIRRFLKYFLPLTQNFQS